MPHRYFVYIARNRHGLLHIGFTPNLAHYHCGPYESGEGCQLIHNESFYNLWDAICREQELRQMKDREIWAMMRKRQQALQHGHSR